MRAILETPVPIRDGLAVARQVNPPSVLPSPRRRPVAVRRLVPGNDPVRGASLATSRVENVQQRIGGRQRVFDLAMPIRPLVHRRGHVHYEYDLCKVGAALDTRFDLDCLRIGVAGEEWEAAREEGAAKIRLRRHPVRARASVPRHPHVRRVDGSPIPIPGQVREVEFHVAFGHRMQRLPKPGSVRDLQRVVHLQCCRQGRRIGGGRQDIELVDEPLCGR